MTFQTFVTASQSQRVEKPFTHEVKLRKDQLSSEPSYIIFFGGLDRSIGDDVGFHWRRDAECSGDGRAGAGHRKTFHGCLRFGAIYPVVVAPAPPPPCVGGTVVTWNEPAAPTAVAPNSIDDVHVVDDGLDASSLATGSVGSDEIQDRSISEGDLAFGAVTNRVIKDGTSEGTNSRPIPWAPTKFCTGPSPLTTSRTTSSAHLSLRTTRSIRRRSWTARSPRRNSRPTLPGRSTAAWRHYPATRRILGCLVQP